MEQFVLCRRKIAYERMQQIYMVQDGGNADNFNMKHAIQLGWKEAGLFERAFLHSLTPFQGLKQIVKNGKNSEKFFQDLDKLFLEFAFCWSTMERFWSTVRNCGHQTRRMYDLDGHYWHVNELGAQHYYGHSLVEILKDPEPAVHQAIQGFFLACAVAFLNSAKKVALAGLDEEESAALGLLVFTRQEVLGMVSVECAKVLREIRRTTLFGLAKHISSCGHSVPERLAQIVALVEPIQEIVLLCKRTSTLLRSACVEHSLPGEFQILMDKVEHEVHQLQGSSQIDLRQK